MRRIKKGALIVGIIFLIPILVLYGYFSFYSNPNLTWSYISNEPLVWIVLYDVQSGESVEASIISIEPKLPLIASPGTGAAGAYIYKLFFSIPAIVVAKAPEYETTRFITVLRRGHLATARIKKRG